jgi:hypothetical protein
MEAKLSSVINGEKWEWQPARLENLVSIQNRLQMVKIGVSDKPIWVISKKSSYTSRETLI